MTGNFNEDIEAMYEKSAFNTAQSLNDLIDKIAHIHPNIARHISQYKVVLLTGIQKDADKKESDVSYKMAVEYVIDELGKLSKKISNHQTKLSKEISQYQELLINEHNMHQNEIKIPQKMAVLSLSESARTLGIFQERGDKNAIKYWQGKVKEYESLLLGKNKPVNSPIKKQKP